MRSVLLLTWAASVAVPSEGGSVTGKAAFVAVFVAVLIWLMFLPRHLLGSGGSAPWWRNVRFWAIVVTLTQISVYLYWG